MDSLARIAATPMRRRRMLKLGAGVIAGATLFPGRVWAGGRPTNCREYCASGTPCPARNPECCCVDSSETAGAWVVPIGGACYDPASQRCCPVKRPDGSSSVVYCNVLRERCGAGGGGPNCECIIPCDGRCCPPDTECRGDQCLTKCPPDWIGARGDLCCPPGMLSTATGCKCTKGQVCKGDSCCPFGYVCGDSEVEFYGSGVNRPIERRRVCVGPPRAGGGWDSKLSYPFLGSAGIGTSAAPRAGRVSAAAAPPFALAISAVAAQGAAALAAWATPRRDRSFRARVRVPRVSVGVNGPPELAALLNAEAKANALLLASGRARSRSLGAIAAGSAKHAFRHAKDSGRFASRAATLYNDLPARRAAAGAALRNGGVAEVSVGPDQAIAFRASVARTLPADLAGALARLGLNAADRRRAQARLAAAPLETAVGRVLIEPLESPQRAEAFAELASDLRSYAASARLKPLNRTTRRAKAVPRGTTNPED